MESKVVAYTKGMTLKEIEKKVILAELKSNNYNRTNTARTLGIGLRTLQRKLTEYGEPHGEGCTCRKCDP